MDQQQSYPRAWCEIQRYLLEGDLLDNFATASEQAAAEKQERDYGYLHGFLRRHPSLAAERFGGYSGGATPFHLIEREKQKKAFPFAYMLAARAPLSVIQEVYELYPQAISERQGEEQGLPLHIACSHGACYDIIQFLVEEYGSAVKEYDRKGNLPLHLMSKCRDQPTDVLHIFQLLLESFPANYLVKENALGISPLVYAIKNDKTTESVMSYLVHKLPASFQEIQFKGVVVGDTSAQNLTHLMPKLKMLTMKGCQILSSTLPVVLTSTSMQSPLLSLTLVNCKIKDDGSTLPQQDTTLPGFQQCTLNNCSMKDNTFFWILDQILLMNNLQQLTLTNPSQKLRALNITSFVVSILRRTNTTTINHNNHLTHLSMDGHALALQALIDVLANENTTTYVDYKNNVHNPKVRYYSTMNQFGRRVAQNPNTSCSELLYHLSGLQQQQDDFLDESFKTVVAYGLLRECPTIWTSGAATLSG